MLRGIYVVVLSGGYCGERYTYNDTEFEGIVIIDCGRKS